MPMKLYQIAELMEKLAPPGLALPWDNCGLLLGRNEKSVSRILLALDATPPVIAEARELKADLIIVHHPLIFNPIKQINNNSAAGSALLELAENGIALYCAHTNLDACKNGVNDALGDALGIRDRKSAFYETNLEGGLSAFGGVGRLDEKISLFDFTSRVKTSLRDENAVFAGEKDFMIDKAGYCCGSGGKYIQEAKALGSDVFVSGDVKHSDALLASALNLRLVVCGHYQSEAVVLPRLLEYLKTEAPGICAEISKSEKAPFNRI